MTALLEEPSFYFLGFDVGAEIINKVLPDHKLNFNLIQVALPRIYRQKYLYCIALYHELGHYVDKHYRISEISLVLDPPDPPLARKEYNHRMEFFADLFAVSYAGLSMNTFLTGFAGRAVETESHPSTECRIEVVSDFIGGKTRIEIDRITQALECLRLPKLQIRYQVPSIAASFNTIRPYGIQSLAELHGIVPAAWDYLQDALTKKSIPWQQANESSTEKIVNDLVEKSVRNWMITEKWNYAATS